MRRLTISWAGPAGLLLGSVLGPATVGPAAAGDLHRVTIERFAFVPERLSVQPGDSVEFVNRDLAPHTATAEGGRWDTGSLARGSSARITFETVGLRSYFCAFHPHMTARIDVVPD